MNTTKGSSSKRKLKKEDEAAARPSSRPKLGVGASCATADRVDNVSSAESLDTTDALLANKEPFNCSLCLQRFWTGHGIVLRECGHKFNKQCLRLHIKSSTTEEISCPYSENGQKCQAKLQHMEIQRLAYKKDYLDFIARNARLAKERTDSEVTTPRPAELEVHVQELHNLTHELESIARRAKELAKEKAPRLAEPEVNVPKLQIKAPELEVPVTSAEGSSTEKLFDPDAWNMDENPLVPNFEEFVCPYCFGQIKQGVGVTLRDCGHNFCKHCLSFVIKTSDAAEIACPLASQKKCQAKLQHREIKQLVSEGEFDLFLQRNAQLAMHCLEEEDIDIPVALLHNLHAFSCPICMEDIQAKCGVVLRCRHKFCRTCLEGHIKYSEGAEVVCPFVENDDKCDVALLHREIRDLVSDVEFEAFLRRSERMAESQAEGSFHCKTPNCSGWCLYEDGVAIFTCPVCQHNNCINCAAIHEGVNCAAYQDSVFQKGTDPTNLYLQKELDKGNAMRCPQCKIIITKHYGCDYMECSMCKHPICWATKGSRWGPKGIGDTSAGCRCGVGQKRCHPKCNNCH